ncbi:Alcohol dehydrogenase 1 [Penicillium angulare]|uniref:Alcohol dehydrogenase 1 n=1 Tax=Penicillium angulare TaxID=116970 RepID=UPI0025421D96|nr:Alcohol dehydrogenase 1 [Penicillium angulare]KAJ5273190.1 Alcohol dehydrogenase 1 [Penicillium angulare]
MASPTTQIAAVIPALGPSDVSNVQISNTHPVPSPGEGEVLIKLEFSGVCHSDVHSIRGDTPMRTDVAGHEGVGKVVSECPGDVSTPAIHATKIPAGLSPDLAAPLLCAGIAMYSSIKKSKARPGDWLAILGAGGGLGHMYVNICGQWQKTIDDILY